MAREAAQLAIYSFIITLINIICICLMALVVLLIKKVVPIIPDNEISTSSSRVSATLKYILPFSSILAFGQE
jgi:ABC-type bacteriocin/lantibiotic exporter with double-glycine peptidase domain